MQATISATFAQIKISVDNPHLANLPMEQAEGSSPPQIQAKLQLWDTAGDQKLRHITRNYFSGAAAALVIYDVTEQESLDVATEWIKMLRESTPIECFICLVGNKTDLLEQTQITQRQGQQFAEENEIEFHIQTSAFDGTNIQELFSKVAYEAVGRKK